MQQKRSDWGTTACFWMTGSALLVLCHCPAVAQQLNSSSPTASLFSQVHEILSKNCFRCHGPDQQKGDLRLDGKAFIARGGHTGNPIIAATPDDSELFLRIESTRPNYRMPATGPLLSREQIELIQRWIEAGAEWTGDLNPTPGAEQDAAGGWFRWLLIRLNPWLDSVENLYRDFRPLSIPLICFGVYVLVVERSKRLTKKRRADSEGADAGSHWFLMMSRLSRWSYVLLLLCLTVSGLWLHDRHQMADAATRISTLQKKLADQAKSQVQPVLRSEFGGPLPLKPRHPKRLGGVYYRGNDEHDPRLFNGGFYRTATMRVWLADSNKTELQWGSPFGEGGLFVGLEIERAPHATPLLFTPRIMETVYLTRQIALRNRPELDDLPVRLTETDPGNKWIAYYPIGELANADGQRQFGVIYVYKGRTATDTTDGKFHFGIRYDIRADKQQVSTDSVIWMGSLSAPFGLLIPRDDQMQLDEWFDFRPIPEIEGENSDDPALLGVPEYSPIDDGDDKSTTTEPRHDKDH